MDLLEFLQRGTLADATTERTLTRLRSDLLAKVSSGVSVSEEVLTNLARFCADHEYVFAETAEDTAHLLKLESESAQTRLITACFRRIEAEETLPLDEVATLSAPSDETSCAVAAQYEQNPYPRWQFLPTFPATLAEKDILIAGCGTGQEPLAIAKAAPRSRLVALDLSRASLAYALARARDFQIANVEFVQGDILNAARLGQSFDEIHCSGVLHHMAIPLKGLLALKEVLKANGTIQIALYSARNRQPALEAIKLRKARGIQPTAEGIRSFRQEILALSANHPAAGASRSQDFYSISGARDLLFHVCEHNYTIRGVAELIEQAGLTLVRFGLGEKPERRFREMGFSDATDLSAWEKVEDAFPGTFSGMYRAIAMK